MSHPITIQSTIWISGLSDKIKLEFFHAVVVFVLLYGSTGWTFMKCLEKELNENYTRILRAVFNEFGK